MQNYQKNKSEWVRTRKKKFFDQKCQWGNCYNSRKKIINFSKNCQKKLNLLTLEQKQGPNYDNFQRTWYLWGFMKKLGSIENFFQNFWPFFVTWGAKSKTCSKNTTFRKKKILESIVAPRDKSSRAFHQNIKTKKRTRGFLSSVNWFGEKFFSEIFFPLRSAKNTKSEPPELDFIVNIFTNNYFEKEFWGILEPQCHKLSKNIFTKSWQ